MRTKESMMAVKVCSSASAMLTTLTTLKPNSIPEKKLRASTGDPLPADVLWVVCAMWGSRRSPSGGRRNRMGGDPDGPDLGWLNDQ